MPDGPRRWHLPASLIATALTTALATGCAPPIRVTGFSPPTNVVSFTHPRLDEYPLQRIAILHFDNRTPTPDAGETIAEFFYQELKRRTPKTVLPPLPADHDLLNLEVPLGHRVAGRLPPPRISPRAIDRVLKQLEPIIRQTLEADEPKGAQPAPVASSPEAGGLAVPSEIRLTEAEKTDALSPAYRKAQERLVDAIVVGVIGRYRNRQGSPITVTEPASVAYDIYLISTVDGAALWQASFDETQVPLFENIMTIERFVKGGGMWQTHDTLTRIGMSRVLASFPGVIVPTPLPAPEPISGLE